MRFLRFSKDKAPSFKEVEAYSEKIKQILWSFQQALECYLSKTCQTFEEHRQDIHRLTGEAHGIRNQIRNTLSRKIKLPVNPFHLVLFLKEEEKILTDVESALEWISYGNTASLTPDIEKDLFLLFESVIDPVEEHVKMVAEARQFLIKKKRKQRIVVLKIIEGISKMSYDVRKIEERLKKRIFSSALEPVATLHLIRLVEIVTSVSEHAGNTADIMLGVLAQI